MHEPTWRRYRSCAKRQISSLPTYYYYVLLLASSKISRPNPNSHLRRRSDPNRAARGYTTTTYNTREGSSSSNGPDNTCDKPGRGDRAQLARGAMDPCAFVRLTVDQLLLKLPSVPRPSSGAAGVHPSTSPCFCTLHLQDHPSAGSHSRTAQLPLASSESPGPVAAGEPVVISLDAAAVQRLSARPAAELVVSVHAGQKGNAGCGMSAGRALGRVRVPSTWRAPRPGDRRRARRVGGRGQAGRGGGVPRPRARADPHGRAGRARPTVRLPVRRRAGVRAGRLPGARGRRRRWPAAAGVHLPVQRWAEGNQDQVGDLVCGTRITMCMHHCIFFVCSLS